MKIIADIDIPFLVEAVRLYWPDVCICPMKPEQIDSSVLADADVLVVRTRTKVDASLLEGTSVQMVCTATIGFDHIDTSYCESHGIRWISCPGSNAHAVCDYISEALREVASCQSALNNYLSPMTIGIVGVGHVGALVADMAERRGMRVLRNDPPKGIGVFLDESDGIEPFEGGNIEECDIITFHTPLNKKTYHVCDARFLSRCRPGAFIINAARGGVVDEHALLHSGHPYILDTWENEPHITSEVLKHAFLASMHIAGYSLEGKRNASQMCLDAIAEHFLLSPIKLPQHLLSSGDNASGWLRRISEELKAAPDSFEALRHNYPLR